MGTPQMFEFEVGSGDERRSFEIRVLLQGSIGALATASSARRVWVKTWQQKRLLDSVKCLPGPDKCEGLHARFIPTLLA